MNMVDNQMFEWHRGRKMYRDGELCPVCPPEFEFDGNCSLAACRWLGWRVAFGIQMMRDKKVREYCEGS